MIVVESAAVRRAEKAATHGVVSRHTAQSCGLSERQVSRLVAAGRWRRLHRGVFWTIPADEVPVLTTLVAARLAASGGVLSGVAAARLWGVDDDRGSWTPELTLPRSVRRRQPPGLRYRWRTLAPDEITVHRGLPVTTVACTLADLARTTPYARMLVLADAALRRRLVDATSLAAIASGLPRRARWALENADGLAESAFESRVRAELLAAKLPPPLLQHEIRDADGTFVARVDFAWPEHRVVVEADGAETHARPAALRGDLRRQNLLVAAGWTVLWFTWSDLGAIAAVVARAVVGSARGVA